MRSRMPALEESGMIVRCVPAELEAVLVVWGSSSSAFGRGLERMMATPRAARRPCV